MGEERNILVIEDDKSICNVISHHLSENGFQVTCLHDGASGLQEALSGKYTLVILDLSLPLLSGVDICKAIRKKSESLPLIMLTARDSETDKVLGLEIGADDYIVKPFSMHELTARVRARLRISAASSVNRSESEEGAIVTCGPLSLSADTRTVTINGTPLELTAKEFDVLEYLLHYRKRVVTREELLQAIWGSTVAAYQETVTSLISRLRRKLEAVSADADFIQTIRGVGFRVIDPADARGTSDSDIEE